MIEVAGVIVRKGKAYIPVHAKSEGGPYYLIEPVFTVDLTAVSLDRGDPIVSHPDVRCAVRIARAEHIALSRDTGR